MSHIEDASRFLTNLAPILWDDPRCRARAVNLAQAFDAMVTLMLFFSGQNDDWMDSLHYVDNCARFFRVGSQMYPENKRMQEYRISANAHNNFHNMENNFKALCEFKKKENEAAYNEVKQNPAI